MTSWIIFMTALVLVSAFLLTYRKTKEPILGICSVALDQTVRKSANKAKVLELLQSGEVSNTVIRNVLGVSRNTVVRHMMRTRCHSLLRGICLSSMSNSVFKTPSSSDIKTLMDILMVD